jgi:glucosamine-6-phosphate deaminase
VVAKVFEDKKSLSTAAARRAADLLRAAIAKNGGARIVAATGVSQLNFLDALAKQSGIDWRRVEMFHLDEYIGLTITHPASFRKYLLDNFIRKAGITKYHLLDADPGRDPHEIARRAGAELNAAPIDIAFVGIGENGHLAFNDPPADFKTEEPYLIVNLDEACRRQQVGEGWFAGMAEVPMQAISMSVRQILKGKVILAIVPESRKAQAVKSCFEGDVRPEAPASILRTHPATTVYLDKNSASHLSSAALSSLAAGA